MTTRIYTIPAREVVPGMLLQNIVGGGWWPVATVTLTEYMLDYTQTAPDGEPAGGMTGLRNMVDVTLPGPSPRELLCSCKSAPCIREPVCGGCRDYRTGNHERHDIDCPVHRLRLRLWPVGATWDGEAWCHVALGWRVFPADLLPADVDAPLNLDEIRAAFCEPEVTP
jgi:hypothetical protein